MCLKYHLRICTHDGPNGWPSCTHRVGIRGVCHQCDSSVGSRSWVLLFLIICTCLCVCVEKVFGIWPALSNPKKKLLTTNLECQQNWRNSITGYMLSWASFFVFTLNSFFFLKSVLFISTSFTWRGNTHFTIPWIVILWITKEGYSGGGRGTVGLAVKKKTTTTTMQIYLIDILHFPFVNLYIMYKKIVRLHLFLLKSMNNSFGDIFVEYFRLYS